MTVPAAFDVCGPLPRGVTVLEASAGTGKTFTIAALAARYVAGGTPLERLLLVTFTRNATGELRERVRDRLVTAERGLARALAGVQPPRDDEVLALLADAPAGEVARRRRRLTAALAGFDAATIATTHGFCQQMLASLGVAADLSADVAFVDDLGDLLAEVLDDLYLRRTLADRPPPFTRAEALRVAAVAVENPLTPLEPALGSGERAWTVRRRLAEAVRREVERRKRAARVITYDDLLTRLVSTLEHPVGGPAAVRRLRERYDAALIDEFQDTDPIQWRILRLAYAETGATLVLIGDPKQAIYAFRGADVYAYLDARDAAAEERTLGVNWRSDQGLVDAYDALFGGTRLGHEGIAYRRVRAAAANLRPRLTGAPRPEPLRVRVVRRADGLVPLTEKGYVSARPGFAHVAADLAAELVRLLSSGAEVVTRRAEGTQAGRERVRPGHVAVLVQTHRNAAAVREALDAVGVPAVINGAGSVFATEVAREWLVLLEALERPASPTRARAAAISVFLGRTAGEVAAAGEADWEDVHARLHRWAALLRQRGVASLLETITHAEGLPGRLLAREDGERRLTDLRHVGQLLHAEATADRLGVSTLAAWLRQRIGEAGSDKRSEERSRRLSSDAEAVQVLTIHRSKGLEFGIVCCPDLWQPGWIPRDEPPMFHDDDGRRTINVGLGGPGFGEHRRRHLAEQRGEDLRLAYVALTRARHQALVWWAGSWESRDSPLGRLLFARDDDGNVASEGPPPPEDAEVFERLGALAAAAPGCVGVEATADPDGAPWQPRTPPAGELEARRFDRCLDGDWRRASYTSIVAGAREPRVGSEPEGGDPDDEPGPGGAAPVPAEAGDQTAPSGGGAAAGEASGEVELRAVPSPLAALPGGAEIGSLVHRVLERVDFAGPDLVADLRRLVEEEAGARRLDAGDPGATARGLATVVSTPLGPLLGEACLADFSAADRLTELDFELPLVGGDRPSGELRLDEVAALLRRHVPRGDPLDGYADRLADPALRRRLRGYLVGTIDLVLRVRDAGGSQRFAVADHKTTWLAPEGEPLSCWHYRPAALAAAMRRGHYPLQALLYSVVAHRYLRWRVPGYEEDRDLAGVFWLFSRGMAGPATPRVGGQPCGVFAWRPPPGLVGALSDLFDRGEVAA